MSADRANNLKNDLTEIRDELQRTAGEIRVKMHLAGMDAKDAWEKVQPRILDFEKRVETKAEDISHEVKDMGEDIRKHLNNIKNMLSEV